MGRLTGIVAILIALSAAGEVRAESARERLKRGVAALEVGEPERARALLATAREELPGWYNTHLYWALADSQINPKISAAALAAFERAAELAPKKPRCRYHLGEAYNRVGQFVKAEGELRRALALRPGIRDAAYQLGVAVRGQGRLPEATTEFERARARNPIHLPTLTALAELYETSGRNTAAEQTLRIIARHDPILGEQGWAVVRYFERLGDDERATEEQQKLSAAGVEAPPARELVARGRAALDAGDKKTAKTLLFEARRSSPQWFAPHLYWGTAMAGQGDDAAALAAIERAVTVAPRNPVCRYHLGVALRRAARTAEAEKSLRLAIEMRPGVADAQYHLALTIRDQGRHQEALGELETARAEDADHAGTLVALAELYEGAQRFDDAEQTLRAMTVLPGVNGDHSFVLLEFLERIGDEVAAEAERRRVEALGVAPSSPRALLWRGVDALGANELEQARKIFAELRAESPTWFMSHLYWAIAELAVSPASPAAMTALERAVELVPYNPVSHYQIGLIHLHARRHAAAEASLRRAIELRGQTEEARFRLAGMLRELGRRDEALLELEAARREAPSHLATLATLAELYEQDERYGEAEEALTQIARLQPTVAYPHYRLAEFLERTGQASKARRVRRQVEAIDPRPKRRMRPLPPARR